MVVQTPNISADTTIELVRSLFTTLLPTTIMAVSFTIVGILTTRETQNDVLGTLVALGCAASIARLTVLLRYRKQASEAFLDLRSAHKLERRFAAAYLGFAVIFGLFCATAYAIAPADTRTVVIGLLFGYGAGVAAGHSLRPRIGIPSILVATVPTITVAMSVANPLHVTVSLLLAVFLAGGVQSMLKRYRTMAADITMRRSFSTLARRDHLTGLLNRLALQEKFDAFAKAAGGVDIIAVHCLDLDRFKPVNDRYGHPVGDALLKAVAGRIEGALRECDFAARTGGDEFVIVQTQAKHADEVSALASRLVAEIATPFQIDGLDIQIATSVGYILSSEYGTDIDGLVARADKALCAVKRAGGGIARYDAATDSPEPQPAIALAA